MPQNNINVRTNLAYGLYSIFLHKFMFPYDGHISLQSSLAQRNYFFRQPRPFDLLSSTKKS